MVTTIIANAFALIAALALPFLLAALAAALLAGVLKAALQLDEQALSFVVRLTAAAAVVYFGAGYFNAQLMDFAKRLWGGVDFYF